MMTTRWIVDTIFSVRFDGGENTGNGQILATVVDVGMQQMVFRASVFALAMSGAWYVALFYFPTFYIIWERCSFHFPSFSFPHDLLMLIVINNI